MRTMISCEGTEVLKGAGNLVSATGYAVCNALVSSGWFIQENMVHSGDMVAVISTPPRETAPIKTHEGTREACNGAKPMAALDDRVTAKLIELKAMECGDQRRKVIRDPARGSDRVGLSET